MLAQLPRHTIAKKVENYEHLDILWGKDVDKVVFPHVLELLKTYTKSVESQKPQLSLYIPSHLISHVVGLRKRDVERELEAPYAQVVSGDISHHAQRPIGLEGTESYESNESDSDETIGDDSSVSFQIRISYADGTEVERKSDIVLPNSQSEEKRCQLSF
jgi:hypothetical protein